MMATIIETANGFIAGDPPTTLGIGEHWCDWCHGDGLDYDWDGELTTCGACCGMGVEDCTNTACPEHSTLHPACQTSAPVA